MKKYRVCLISILCIFYPAEAWPRLFNYQDLPVGERSYGMGNATMALHGDVGAMYFNPAVMAWSEANQITAALTAYNRYDSRTGEYVGLFESATDNLTRGGFLAIPTMFGGQVTIDKWVWGGTLLIPDSYQNSGVSATSATTATSYESKSESVWVGSFLARRLNERHNIGLSLFYVSPSLSETMFFVNRISDETLNLSLYDRRLNYNGLLLIFGGTYQINSNLTTGYSWRTPLWGLSGSGSLQKAHSGDILDSGNLLREFNLQNLPMPWRLSWGIAWQANSRLILAGDLHLYGSTEGNMDPAGSDEFSMDTKPVVNFSLGAEWAYNEGFWVRIGCFSNFTAAESLKVYPTALDDKVNMFAGTLALVLKEKTGTLTLGGYVQAGQGRSVALDNQSIDLVPRSNYFYGIMIGSNYLF